MQGFRARACSCPVSQDTALPCPALPTSPRLPPWGGFSAPPHSKTPLNVPVSPVSHNVNGQKEKPQNHSHEGKCQDGVIPC